MIYLDSAYLAKLYIREHGSEDVERWLQKLPEQVACCLHGRLEVISAFKRQQREQRINETQVRAAVRRFEAEEKAGIIRWLAIDALLMSSACERMAKLPPSVFLRAADALHLACASDAGLKEIYSHDRHLLAAAPHFGLRGIDVIPSPRKSSATSPLPAPLTPRSNLTAPPAKSRETSTATFASPIASSRNTRSRPPATL